MVQSLEAALWAFYSTDNFKDGCLAAVNLGNDADTTAAIYGQIAGAFYGVNGIPAKWRDRLAMRQEIEALAEELFNLAADQVSLKEVKPSYFDENGVLCINAHCTGANADPIRAARLAVKAKKGNKQAIKDLAELNSSKVYGLVDKGKKRG